MATRERRSDRADRLADETLASLGRELRRARIGAGVSQRTLEAATGVSHSEICRLERGRAPNVPLRTLVVLATSLGLVIPARPYPEGDAIRDAGHARLLERFRSRLHPSLRWRTEVPLPSPGDRRSWDAVTGATSWRAGVEAPRNRRALAAAPAAFADYPVRGREILVALAAGREPRGSGIVLL